MNRKQSLLRALARRGFGIDKFMQTRSANTLEQMLANDDTQKAIARAAKKAGRDGNQRMKENLGMLTNKEKVQQKYPKACAKQWADGKNADGTPRLYWVIHRDLQNVDNDMDLGIGLSARWAWMDAANKLKKGII